MKRVISLFCLLFFSVWLGLWLHQGKSTLTLLLENWTIEMPLWLAVGAILLGYFILMASGRMLGRLIHVGRWLKSYSKQAAQSNTRRGLIAFNEGDWKKAEHYLIKAKSDSKVALINYLTAARAAQELGASERRDEYLREAQNVIPEARMAIELTQAQLQMMNGQWEQALATLTHLNSSFPHHPYVIKLLVKVYLSLKDWTNLEEYLPIIRRKKIMNEKEAAQLEKEVYLGILEQASSFTEVKNRWADFPKAIRSRPTILAAYIRLLLENKADDEAEPLCREALKNTWDNELIVLYGQCHSENKEEQLRFAEIFLKYYGNNPYLLLTLGRICLRCQLWGKAKSYLTKSAQLQLQAETCLELAKLSEQLGEKELMLEYYKQGLDVALARRGKLRG